MEDFLKPQPELVTERLVLKEIDDDHYHSLYSFRNNLELCELSGMKRDLTIIDTIKFMNHVNRNIASNNFYYWGIFLKDELIGVISLAGVDEFKRSGEFGYFTGFKYQRQGYMFEALHAVMTYLFETCHASELNAYIRVDNVASQQLVSKLGYQQKEKSEEEDMGGNILDMYRYTIKRSWFNV